MKEEELKDLEKKLWEAADKMRGAVPVSSYKFIVLGLIFLKYISDSFEEKYQELVKEGYGLEEDRDAYVADNIFYVPTKARWEYLNTHSKDSNIGENIDKALEEKEGECLNSYVEIIRHVQEINQLFHIYKCNLDNLLFFFRLNKNDILQRNEYIKMIESDSIRTN